MEEKALGAGAEHMHSSSIHKIEKKTLLDADRLPEALTEGLLPAIQARLADGGPKIVVLDDDPTGTQTVHGIPVLTHWSIDALADELQNDAQALYLLTNSRSMSTPEACQLAAEIGTRLHQASQRTGVPIEVISRSDSTLRGHFPDEVDAMARAMGDETLPYLVVPCFFEGGRYTVNDVHYVAEEDWLIPAAETAYARDAAFGYDHSNLRDWVEEKTNGRICRNQVASITLEDIRSGGPRQVARKLTDVKPGSACVVNAVAYSDLEVTVMGLLEAERRGYRFLLRTAASFVRVRAGIAPRDLLGRAELVEAQPGQAHGGLFVVGSYVPKTTEQVAALRSRTDITGIEIQVGRLLDDGQQAAEIERVCLEINPLLQGNRDVVIFTSRDLATGADAGESLSIGQRISDSLIGIVDGLQVQPRYLVAKGGITSSDVATLGLGVRRAMVMGQILPGVPVWRLGGEARYPGMAYVVFPGNVGDANALVDIKERLRGH